MPGDIDRWQNFAHATTSPETVELAALNVDLDSADYI